MKSLSPGLIFKFPGKQADETIGMYTVATGDLPVHFVLTILWSANSAAWYHYSLSVEKKPFLLIRIYFTPTIYNSKTKNVGSNTAIIKCWNDLIHDFNQHLRIVPASSSNKFVDLWWCLTEIIKFHIFSFRNTIKKQTKHCQN